MKSHRFLACILLTACLFSSGCDFNFPLTATATRKIEVHLIGDWIAIDPGNEKPDVMHVRQYDDFTYVVSLDHDLYRAYHSDFSDTPFLSVQDLNGGDRKYLYFTWRLSPDSTQLTLKSVNTETIPETTKTSAEIQDLIKRNLSNPKLFRAGLQFKRKKAED